MHTGLVTNLGPVPFSPMGDSLGALVKQHNEKASNSMTFGSRSVHLLRMRTELPVYFAPGLASCCCTERDLWFCESPCLLLDFSFIIMTNGFNAYSLMFPSFNIFWDLFGYQTIYNCVDLLSCNHARKL